MAKVERAYPISVAAGEDLTGKLYRFAVIDSTGRMVGNTTADGVVHGIVNEVVDAAGKESSMIVPDGCIAKITLGASLSAGALVGSDNAGRAKAAGTALNNYATGILLQGGAINEVVSMIFLPVGRHGGAS